MNDRVRRVRFVVWDIWVCNANMCRYSYGKLLEKISYLFRQIIPIFYLHGIHLGKFVLLLEMQFPCFFMVSFGITHRFPILRRKGPPCFYKLQASRLAIAMCSETSTIFISQANTYMCLLDLKYFQNWFNPNLQKPAWAVHYTE